VDDITFSDNRQAMLVDTVKAKKLAYYGHSMRKQGSCLEKEIMQRTVPGARRRGMPRTAWIDNIKTWTGLAVEESIRMTEDRDKWRKYVQPSDRGRLKIRSEQVGSKLKVTYQAAAPNWGRAKCDVYDWCG